MTGVDMTAGSLTVEAGTAEKPNNPQATVLGITGGLGGVAVNVNVGLALNQGTNDALLTGEKRNTSQTNRQRRSECSRERTRTRLLRTLQRGAGGSQRQRLLWHLPSINTNRRRRSIQRDPARRGQTAAGRPVNVVSTQNDSKRKQDRVYVYSTRKRMTATATKKSNSAIRWPRLTCSPRVSVLPR